MRYYLLECLSPAGELVRDIKAYPATPGIDSWMLGALFQQPPSQVIQLEWDPQTHGGMKALYSSNIPLMRRTLLDALRTAGVDNIDGYPVEIVDAVTGQVSRDFVAFNVIGAVRTADLSQSEWSDPSGMRRIDMDFESLAVSADAARGLLLFRLAECVTGIVIHEAVRRHLESGGFGLTFVPPEDWLG